MLTNHDTTDTDRRRRRSRPIVAGLAAVTGMLALAGVPDAAAAPASEVRTAAKKVAASHRVDLAIPGFSNPTEITNPLFPKSTLHQVIQLGEEAGDQLRFEVTQLEKTRTIEWNGQQIETVVTHFMAFTNGRLVETALDYYAQGDDGSVWYFGENVDNYEDGVIANHDGTWLAGVEGPPGMIMPADPQVGDVYRPENAPGVVFEEATVLETGLTVDGPRGHVAGAIRIRAALLDGTVEEKIYAPGYGEFEASVASADELYHAALAVPVDHLAGRLPRELRTMATQADEVFDSAARPRWRRIAQHAARLDATWSTYRTGAVPPLVEAEMHSALGVLHDAIDARDRDATRQAALDVGQVTLDLHLRFRPVHQVDRERIDQWRDQRSIDRAASDVGNVAGDNATIAAIRDRIAART